MSPNDNIDAARLGLSHGVPPTIQAALTPVRDLPTAQAYTRTLTQSHYENFSVVSTLLPKSLRQDFCNVYAFCRVADDLGDEVGDTQLALDYLGQFKQQLRACYEHNTQTAVFVALAQTIARHHIPIDPFMHLIEAFEQDQRINRYDTFEQVVDYCRRSADPVGRLVLYMCGYSDPERQRLSDKTCTALQLANFWQDVRRDYLERNRIYLPRETMNRFGVTEEQIQAGHCDDHYRAAIRFEVDRTAQLFQEGRALLPMLAPQYRRQIALFGAGGQAILQAIRRQYYDTLTRRPSLSRWQKGRLVTQALIAYIAQTLLPARGNA